MATLDDKLVFSAQALGQPAYGSLDVVNLGTRPLTITSVTFDNPAFSLDAALNALNNPFDVAPGKTGYVAVDFVPTEFGHLTATATILAVEDGPLRLSLPIDAMTTVDTVCHGYCGPRGVQGGCGLDRHHPLLEGALRPLLLFGSIALALRRRRRVEGALASK